MLERIEWSHNLRVQLYKAVIKEMGTPQDIPRTLNGKPLRMSKADFIMALDVIGESIGTGPGKGKAISNQIAWVLRTPSAKCHQGHWNAHNNNVIAAMEAGYICRGTGAKLTLNSNGILVNTCPTQPSNVLKKVWGKLKGWFS